MNPLRVVTKVGEERSKVSGGMGGVVVVKGCLRQEAIPIILMITGENMAVLLENLIYTFGLTISLRVIHNGEVELDT